MANVSAAQAPGDKAAHLTEVPAAPAAGTYPARYKIIRGADMMDLATAVNKSIQSGWLPIGGIAYVPPSPLDVMKQSSVFPYWQAMYRDEIREET